MDKHFEPLFFFYLQDVYEKPYVDSTEEQISFRNEDFCVHAKLSWWKHRGWLIIDNLKIKSKMYSRSFLLDKSSHVFCQWGKTFGLKNIVYRNVFSPEMFYDLISLGWERIADEPFSLIFRVL